MKYFVASDGARLAYRDEGAGLPLLALSGLTRNGTDFDYLAPHLDALHPGGIRLIRLDYRGRGESEFDPDWRNYDPVIEARDAVALLTAIGLHRADFLGTSRGGQIIFALAAMRPALINRAILNDIGPVIAMLLDPATQWINAQRVEASGGMLI